MKRIVRLLSIVVAALGCMCVSCSDGAGVRGVEHVVVIGLDGFAGNTVETAEMPTLKAMMAEGAWTLQARSILPSSSACNWASMFMGVGPEMHGYNTWGSSKPDFPSIYLGEHGIFPTIFTILKEQHPEAKTMAMYEWHVQACLIDSMAVDHYRYIPVGDSRSADLTNAYADYIKAEKPHLSMALYDTPDYEGHHYGWGSDIYYSRLTEMDAHIATIIEATKEAGIYDKTIFMIVADHGGIEMGHGRTSMAEMEAPLVFFGKGVKKGHKIAAPVVRYDTAPTIAYILGLQTPSVWRGRAITEVFE